MVKHWMKWCRLCAREDSSNTHVNIFHEDEKGLALSDTLNKCFSIDINNFNDWPHMVCVECYCLAKSIINMSHRASKVHAMFFELLDGNDDLDADEIKERYGLHRNCDIKFDLKPQFVDITTIVDEPEMPIEMVNVDKLQNIDGDMLNITVIKTEETDEDYVLGQSDRIPTPHDGSEAPLKNISHDEKPQNTKRNNRKKDPSTKPAEDSDKEESAEKSTMSVKKRRIQTEPYQCEKCPRSFLRVQFHRRHMEKFHGIILEEPKEPLEFVCDECGKKCKSDWKLKYHQLTHSSERPLKCSHCDKRFKNRQRLKVHEDTHNETNYICAICGLKLNTRKTLDMHMVVHSDQKQHKCDFCGNEYKRAKALKTHLILHTGLKPYTCDFCDRTFANGANCRTHKKKTHPVELAALEAAGKNTVAAGIPKLEDLRAKTASKLKNVQPNVGSEVDKSEDSRGESETCNKELLKEFKSLIKSERTQNQSLESYEGVF
ncbi:zinc finger protein weckle-like [Eupeodes corollae]|uniref:zinc finger protein weckle-like n=1 Tax=Eupeodes corollae TaxID=290404 RepID=UPI002492CA09|nr:zinc finger protein weckle-like [Eupeodes corollae]